MRGWIECAAYRHLQDAALWSLRISVAPSHTQLRTERGETLTRRAQIPRQAEEVRIRHRNGTARYTTGRIVFQLFVVYSLALAALGNQADAANAKIEGSVFVRDSAGNQSFVAGAIVKFSGPATFQTESDENGEYVIAAMPPGTYAVEAVFESL